MTDAYTRAEVLSLIERLEAPVITGTTPAHHVTIDGVTAFVPQSVQTARDPLRMEAAAMLRALIA